METDDGARFMALVERLLARAPAGMGREGAAILMAVHLGIAADSRSLSSRLGIAHALVLREIAVLGDLHLQVLKRDGRTQRCWIEPTPLSQSLLRDL